MESNSNNSNQGKEKLVSLNSSVLTDIVISSSSSSDSEEQESSLTAIKNPSWSLFQTSNTTKTNNSKAHFTWTKDPQDQTDNQKASQNRKIQGSKLFDTGLDNTSTSSNTDLEVGVVFRLTWHCNSCEAVNVILDMK